MDIKGSYILHEPLQNKEQYLNRLVYQGGITQNKNNRDIEYTFYADAHTQVKYLLLKKINIIFDI